MDPGELTLRLRNDDGALDPWNTASPYYGNLLDAETADLVTTTGDWNPSLNCAVTRSTSQAYNGAASLRLEASANGNMAAATGSGTNAVPVRPSKPYTASALFRAAALANFCLVSINWFDSGGSSISATNGTIVTDSTSGWTLVAASATSPSTAAYASVTLKVNSAIITEQHYVDTISLTGGSGNTLWYAGDLDGLVQPRTRIDLPGWWNHLTLAQSDVTSPLTGWNALSNCSIARTTAQTHFSSGSILLTATGAGQMVAGTDSAASGRPVYPRTQYTASCVFLTALTNRNCFIGIRWWDSGGAFISESDGSTVADFVGAWALAGVTATSPSNAAYADIVIKVNSAAGSEQHYAADFTLNPGTSTLWYAGGARTLFTGYIESIKPVWPAERYAEVEITAVDGFTVLGRTKLVDTAHYDAVQALTPDGFYRLGESGTASVVNGLITMVDSSAHGRDGTYKQSVSFAHAGALPTEANTAIEITRGGGATSGGWGEIPSTACPNSTADFSVEAWVWPRSFGQSPVDRIWHVAGVGAQSLFLAIFADGTLNFVATATNGGSRTTTAALTLGRWNHVVAVKSGTTGPGNWAIYIDGVDVSGTTSTDGTGNISVTQNYALIGGFEVSGVGQGAFDGFIDEFAIFPSALSAGQVTTLFAAAHTLTTPSLAGDRIDALLDLAGWPAADRSLDAGQFMMRPVTSSLTDTFVLPYLLDLVDAEGYPAALFMGGNGSVVFEDRSHATPASVATFGDGVSELAMIRKVSPPVRDDANLWTVITGQSADGEPQTVTDTVALARYGPSSPSTLSNLQNSSDADVLTLITDLLARYGTPADRSPSFMVIPGKDPASLYPLVMTTDINDRFAMNRHTLPGGGAALLLDQRVEGVEHAIEAGKWETTWRTVPT